MAAVSRTRRHDDHPHIAGSRSTRANQLARQTVAVVLAGGRGTRLRQLTEFRAKPAVPFGGKLRIIDFSLSNCVNSGIRRVAVLTQYKSQSLIRHIERGWSFLAGSLGEYIDIVPAQQRIGEGWYCGTADAVYQNLNVLRDVGAKYVLILAGDHVYKMDFSVMLAEHVARRADLTLACLQVPRADAAHYGVLAVDDEARVLSFVEKPADPTPLPGSSDTVLASMGIYIFGASFLSDQLTRDAADAASSHDFAKDVIPRLLAQHRVYAHHFVDSCVNMVGARPYWRDVGTIDAYWEANMDLTHVVPELNLYDDDWPIFSHQPQLPPAKFVFDDELRRGTALDSVVSGGCIVSGATVRRSVLFANVRVGDYSLVEDSVVLPDVVIGRNVTLRRVVVDKHCALPDGFTAGVDAASDQVRFQVSERGIALVTPGMLGQSVFARTGFETED